MASLVCLLVAVSAIFGGNWNNAANYGVWCWNLNNAASNANSNIGSHQANYGFGYREISLKIGAVIKRLAPSVTTSALPLGKIEWFRTPQNRSKC